MGFEGSPAARGYDNYISFSGWVAGNRPRTAGNLNAVTIPEMERLAAQDKPFLLFLRHMDPHSPYLAPEPFHRMFFQGDEFDENNKSLEPVYQFKPFCDYFYDWFPPGCTSSDYIVAQYDAAIAYMDACIQPLLQKLADLGLEDDTIVVFTSDHGETLYDHDHYFDHHGLYDCTLVVPLILRWNNKLPRGVRVDDYCQLKDVMPTLLDLVGIDGTPYSFDGRSLLPALEGKREKEPEFYITECTWQRKHGWRTPNGSRSARWSRTSLPELVDVQPDQGPGREPQRRRAGARGCRLPHPADGAVHRQAREGNRAHQPHVHQPGLARL